LKKPRPIKRKRNIPKLSKLDLASANSAAAVAVGATSTNPLRKHQSQKPMKKKGGGDKQGPGGSKQGGRG
jgi:hypothetical protein